MAKAPKNFTKLKTDAIILNIMNKWQQEILNRMTNFKGKNMLTGRSIGKSWSIDAIRRLKDDLGDYKLHTDVSTVYGKEYYTVQPVGWMHADDNHQWHDMMRWMLDTFGPCSEDQGPGVWTPDQRWYVNNAKFWFRDVKDRDWFIMRWS